MLKVETSPTLETSDERLRLAIEAEQAGLIDVAMVAYGTLSPSDPIGPVASINLAFLLLKKRQVEEALALLQQVVDVSIESSQTQ